MANWVAGQLAPLNNNITFIGHSLGGLMAAAVGNILHSSEDFDIITLDAAFEAIAYDLDRWASGKQQVGNLKDVSDNAIAFVAEDFWGNDNALVSLFIRAGSKGYEKV